MASDGDIQNVANGVFRLLNEQRTRLELAIKAADQFKAGASQRGLASSLPQTTEEELTQRISQEEDKLAGMEKQMAASRQELESLRQQIAEKKGEPAPKKEAATAPAAPSPEAEKWMEENLGGIRKSINDQAVRLKDILAEAEKYEANVSNLARLRTRLSQVKNKIPFTQIALDDIKQRVEMHKGMLGKL